MDTKTEILKLFNEYSVQENSNTLNKVIEEKDFNSLAEELVKIISPNPDVSGRSEQCAHENTVVKSVMCSVCKDCGNIVESDV